jgi:uncharacterized protein (TIGR02270 family)
MAAMVIGQVISQYAEEAAFLWLLRRNGVTAPNYSMKDLTKLDYRLEAHLDGLRIAGDAGWEICAGALTQEEPGEVFTAAILAFESGDGGRIQTVVEAGLAKAELSRGLVSALGWLSFENAEGHIRNLLASEWPVIRRLGIAASAVHRRDPGTPLAEALSDDNPYLKARALRAAGELGRTDLLPLVSRERDSGNVACRFGAAWSLALLGEADAAEALWSFVKPDDDFAEEAVRIAMRRADPSQSLVWQRAIVEDLQTHRLAAVGAGVIGDPVLVPWLFAQMNAPPLARVAGEAFTMITGVDIAYEDLEGERPEGFESGPTENPEDENVEMDPDEDLPWPDPELIQGWWGRNKGQFRNGTRYLMGQPISSEHLNQVLRTGRQRQRAAAALELAISKPGIPLFEVRAPGFRQKILLGIR